MALSVPNMAVDPIPQPQKSASQFGNPAYDEIGGYFKNLTGKDATQEQVSQWGNKLDDNYRANIQNAIYQTPEAQAYRKAQTSTVDPTQPKAEEPAAEAQQASAPTTPVTATGGIPPPAAPAAAPVGPKAVAGNRNIADVAAMPTYQAQSFTNSLTPTDISQYAAPDQSHVNGQQNTLLDAIMAHPETMDANTIAQLKEQQKEQALLLGQQDMGQYSQNAVARGTLNSGQTQGYRANSANNINNAILSGNRATDLAAIAQNRQDQLNALGASTGVAQDQLGRSTQAYGTGLQGQMAQDSSKLSHAQFGLGVDQANAQQKQLEFQSQADSNNSAFARALAAAQNQQGIYGQDLQAQFGNSASTLDLQKFLESQRQFNQSLDNNQSQFGQTLGFNYNQLDQNGNLQQQQNLLSAIRGA